jgi:CO/xanthine dehydrogenase FAD-binding subunit
MRWFRAWVIDDMILREARPWGDNAYKLTIARALVRRTLMKLVA